MATQKLKEVYKQNTDNVGGKQLLKKYGKQYFSDLVKKRWAKKRVT
jgi:hypothetical protein